MLGTVIALVVVQVVLTIAVAIFAPKEAGAPRDERDKLIELRAMRFAYAGLATGIAVACFFGALIPLSSSTRTPSCLFGDRRDHALRLPDRPIPSWRLIWARSATKSGDCASSTAR